MKRNLRFCRFFYSKVKGLFFMNLGALLLVHIFAYAVPYATKVVMDRFFFQKNYQNLWIYLCGFIGVLVFAKVISTVERITAFQTDEKANCQFRNRSFQVLFKKSYTQYSIHNYGEVDTVYNDSIMKISNSIYCILESMISVPTALILGGGLILTISPLLFIFLSAEILLMMGAVKMGARKRAKAYEKSLKARKSYFNSLQKTVNSFENIRANFIETKVFKRLFHKSDVYKSEKIKYHNKAAMVNFGFDLIEVVFQIATIIFFIFMIKENGATPGEYLAYIGVKEVIIGVFNGAAQMSIRYKELDVAVQDIDKLVQLEKLMSRETSRSVRQLEDIREITMDNVRFTYDDSSFNYNFNLRFKRGNIYVIQGENGIGKSTLIRMVTGLIQPQSGRVLINDRDLNSLEGDVLFNRIRVLTQNTVLFDDTLRNNLMREEDKPSEEYFDLNGIIQKYSNGIQSNVFEDGINLSGGQVKKIAMNSMFYSDSEVLIFDEPFAALDEQSKAEFYGYIKKIHVDKIIIMISHESSWQWDCNEVFMSMREKDNNVGLEIMNKVHDS